MRADPVMTMTSRVVQFRRLTRLGESIGRRSQESLSHGLLRSDSGANTTC